MAIDAAFIAHFAMKRRKTTLYLPVSQFQVPYACTSTPANHQPMTSNLMQSIDVYIILCTKTRERATAFTTDHKPKQLLVLFYIEIMANIWDLNQCWNETCSIVHSIEVQFDSRIKAIIKKSQQTASVAAKKAILTK